MTATTDAAEPPASASASPWRTIATGLCGAMLLCGLALTAFWRINSEFAVYDDEGYALYSLMDFARGGGLYTELYSQYGPFFFGYHHALFSLLNLPWTHDAGRLVTLIHWVAAAAACGGITRLLTRSNTLGLAGMTASFMLLQLTYREPNHPGALCALLISAGLFIALACERRTYMHAAGFALGACGMALMLVKINIGLFFLIAAGIALLLACRPFPGRPMLLGLSLAGSLALPWVLMHALLHDPWVRTYALNFSAAAVVAAIALYPRRGIHEGTAPPAVIASFATGAILCLTGVCGYILATGTRPLDVIDGVILGPLRHPGVLNIPFPWMSGTLWLAGLGIGLAIILRLRVIPYEWLRYLRAGAVIMSVVFMFEPSGDPLAYWIFCYFPLVFALFAIPWTDAESRHPGWALVALALLFQYLHAYPVAGSQVFWAVFLTAPLWLATLAKLFPQPGHTPDAHPRWRMAVESGVLLLCVAAVVPYARVSYSNYTNNSHLQLSGSADIRLNTMLGTTLRILDENIRQHAGVLFTMPGMMSLNLWSGVPPPTRRNTTQWASLLSEPAQADIAGRLGESAAALWIVADWHVDFLRERDLFRETPLVQSLENEWQLAFRFRRFSVWSHRGRILIPWQSILAHPHPSDQAPGLLLTCLPFEGDAERLVVKLHDSGKTQRFHLNAENTVIFGAAVAADGTRLHDPRPMDWPLRVKVPTILWLETGAIPANPNLNVRSHAMWVDVDETVLAEFIHIQPAQSIPALR